MVHDPTLDDRKSRQFGLHATFSGYLYAQSLYTTILMLIGDGIDPCTRLQYYCFIHYDAWYCFHGFGYWRNFEQYFKVKPRKTKYELKLEDVAECMNNLEMPNDLKIVFSITTVLCGRRIALLMANRFHS